MAGPRHDCRFMLLQYPRPPPAAGGRLFVMSDGTSERKQPGSLGRACRANRQGARHGASLRNLVPGPGLPGLPGRAGAGGHDLGRHRGGARRPRQLRQHGAGVPERKRRQDAGDDPGDCRHRHGGGRQDGPGHQRHGVAALPLRLCPTSSATPSTRRKRQRWRASVPFVPWAAGDGVCWTCWPVRAWSCCGRWCRCSSTGATRWCGWRSALSLALRPTDVYQQASPGGAVRACTTGSLCRVG